jgi:hypothetical protein
MPQNLNQPKEPKEEKGKSSSCIQLTIYDFIEKEEPKK